MVLTGDRIRLREYRDSDRDIYRRLETDVAGGLTHRGGSRHPLDDHELDAYLERRRTIDGQRYLFTVATGESDAPIGRVAIRDIHPIHRRATLGVALIGPARGQGLGHEAIDLACEFAFDELNLHRIAVEVHGDNEASRTAFANCGFTEESRRPRERFHGGQHHDVLILAILAHEWRDRPRTVPTSDEELA